MQAHRYAHKPHTMHMSHQAHTIVCISDTCYTHVLTYLPTHISCYTPYIHASHTAVTYSLTLPYCPPHANTLQHTPCTDYSNTPHISQPTGNTQHRTPQYTLHILQRPHTYPDTPFPYTHHLHSTYCPHGEHYGFHIEIPHHTHAHVTHRDQLHATHHFTLPFLHVHTTQHTSILHTYHILITYHPSTNIDPHASVRKLSYRPGVARLDLMKNTHMPYTTYITLDTHTYTQ